MIRALVLLTLFATPAGAQSVFDRAAGLYGSATNPAESCAVNPHHLDFMAAPPHAIFTWAHPVQDHVGQTRSHARYDILGYDENSITLRLEGQDLHTDSGGQAIWILRLTSNPEGYCWGRTDWPDVRCVEPAVRCGEQAPTS
jgi:hypothetical protein